MRPRTIDCHFFFYFRAACIRCSSARALTTMGIEIPFSRRPKETQGHQTHLSSCKVLLLNCDACSSVEGICLFLYSEPSIILGLHISLRSPGFYPAQGYFSPNTKWFSPPGKRGLGDAVLSWQPSFKLTLARMPILMARPLSVHYHIDLRPSKNRVRSVYAVDQSVKL